MDEELRRDQRTEFLWEGGGFYGPKTTLGPGVARDTNDDPPSPGY